MKFLIFLHIILIIRLISCEGTYPGLDYDLSGDDIVVDEEFVVDSTTVDEDRIPVTLSIIDPSFTTLSRSAAPSGSGAFDAERPEAMRLQQWGKADFHIFGIRKSEDADYSVSRESDSTMCIIDNAIARVTDLNSLMLTFNTVAGDEPVNYYWSNNHPLNKFNFYAYYLDNLEKPTLNRSADGISLNIEIDGSQDILTGYAQLTQRQESRINAHEEKDSLMKYHYSTYTATRDVFPVVNLDHELVRLKFFIYPGDATANNMVVQSIKIYANYKGTLTVAHRDSEQIGAVWSSQKTWLTLRDEGDEPKLATDKYRVPFKEGDEAKNIYDRTGMQVGESLLVPPATSYTIEVSTIELGEDDTSTPYVTEYVIENQDLFKPNYEYSIRIGLYGPEQLSVDAILTGWVSGGKVITDMDDNFN